MARFLSLPRLSVAIFLLGSLSAIASSPQQDDTYLASWLRRGCVLAERLKAEGKSAFQKWSHKEVNTFYGVMHFYQGYLRGMNDTGLHFESGSAPKTLYPPDEWLVWDNVAPQILVFMQKHSDEISNSAPANSVLAAWVWSEHPRANEKEKIISKVVLERLLSECRAPAKDK